ncbi:MAG: carboxypeptidase regulatory-like domain-containing protein [Candidatus Neomarinimicrobiota bacterium]
MTIKEFKWVVSPLLALLVVTTLCSPAFGGTTGKISGSVRDIETGEALPGANVVIVGTTLGAATDVTGDFFVINVPPGTYSVRVTMIGYAPETRTNVIVNVDRTTNINFRLRITVIPGEEVTAVAERPIIRPDLTASITEISGDDIELGPAENLQDQIRQQRGVLLGLSQLGTGGYRFSSVPSDELHLRGGRENETLFAVDGMTVNDPLWGGSDYAQNTSASSVTEMSTLAGTFNAEYGNAMSGVINVITREGTEKYQGHFSSYSDQLGVADWDQGTSQAEISLSGPIPLTGNKVTFFINAQTRATDGYLYGYIYPNWVDSRGEEVDTLGIPNGGTPKEISMDKKELLNGLVKLTWRVSPKIKISTFAAYSDSKEAFYDHWMKYNPEGSPYHYSTDLMLNLSMTHTLGARTFYDLGVSHQRKSRFLGVYDSWDDYMVVLEESDPTGNWSVSGEDWTWHHDDSEISGLRFALTSQVTKVHLLKTGVNYRKLALHRDSRNPNEVGMFYINYDRQPTEVAAFLQDKMEFSKIGMILNAGVRFDMWDADAPYWVDISDLAGMETKQATPKKTVSPRFGVSYPISDIGAFHFAYGHFYQFPSYTLVYQGQRELTNKEDYYYDNEDYDYEEGELYYPMTEMYDFRLANGDMEPEMTVAYEAGVQTKVTEDVSIDITAFYREMSNLVGERFVTEAAAGAGIKYSDNYDYGNSKGVEIVLNKRFSNYFSLRANYTFAKALITSSTPWTQIQVANPTYRTFIANWDRPHTFSFDLLIGEPGNWTVGLYGNFQSGLPYSIRVEPNTERMPWLGTLDVRASKSLHLLGFEESVFLRVLNLLDYSNIYSVYASSGKPDLPLGIERNARNLNIYDDPSNYGPGRQVRLGLSVDF